MAEKNIFKKIIIQAIRGKPKYAVVIAGLGLCGTTMMLRSFLKHGFSRKLAFVEDLDRVSYYERGAIYKTHAYPPKHLDKSVRLVFMFGNPMNIAISAHKRINHWGRTHHEHLHSDGYVSNDSILKRDTLKLGELFATWHRPQNFRFLSLKYEMLYQNSTRKIIDKFFGFHVELLPFRERETNWKSHNCHDQLLLLYGDLARLIEHAPSAKIW